MNPVAVTLASDYAPASSKEFFDIQATTGCGFTLKRVFETNIYRIQGYGSIICGYFCIGFIDFMLNGKSLLEYANLFSKKIKKFLITKMITKRMRE